MSYLVDGNNVMGQRVGWHKDKAGARRRLLVELMRFARASRVRVGVVFDGAPDEHFPDGSSFMGAVVVHYAARGSNADERIKRMVDESRERQTLVVVTSDRELAGYVRQSGVRVVRAGEFRRRLDETDDAAGGAREATRAGVSGGDIDRWMRYFGVAPEDDEAD